MLWPGCVQVSLFCQQLLRWVLWGHPSSTHATEALLKDTTQLLQICIKMMHGRLSPEDAGLEEWLKVMTWGPSAVNGQDVVVFYALPLLSLFFLFPFFFLNYFFFVLDCCENVLVNVFWIVHTKRIATVCKASHFFQTHSRQTVQLLSGPTQIISRYCSLLKNSSAFSFSRRGLKKVVVC